MAGREKLKVGGLLLAAGGSSRLGRPKQLVEFKGKTLLRHAAESMAASICDPVVAVLGAEAGRSATEIDGLQVAVCINENWHSGMSSSIRSGIEKLVAIEPMLDAVLISLCDQPFINTEMLNRFGEKFAEGRQSVIAAKYNGVAGVPALFSRELFSELSRLEGDKGARDLIRSQRDLVTIDLPEAAFDIDTPDDAAGLTP